MMTTTNSSTNIAPGQPKRIMSGNKREAESVSVTDNGEPPAKRPYYGKCQYKTGKCFNERTLKRNGEAHSLCEEHRIKQNLIQRRSDRKYQTVHAIRRRERSQRRAVLKKQVSMAVAQQLFYEHQQQKTLGVPLPQDHPLHSMTGNSNGSEMVGLAPPIQVPQSSSFVQDLQNGLGSPLIVSFQPQNTGVESATSKPSKNESSPTGIDDFTPDTFLNISLPGALSMPGLRDDEIDECGSMKDSFGYMPIVTCSGDKDAWSDDDIEFLQTILLA